MPTFKKSKSLEGLFTDQQIASAVNDVMKNGLKVREAARKYNLCHTTISRYIKRIRKSEIDANQIRKISMATMQVFTEEEESALVDHLITASKVFHGLSTTETRELAYNFATKKQKRIPESWESSKAAGKEWLKGFRKRNKRLSLRQPEATSLARASAFNKHNVEMFFKNLKDVPIDLIPPERIFNLDETGISTVQKVGRILAETGTKQVGRITSAERGETVTMCACVSAIGNSFPPAFIFPRVRFKDHMMKGAPNSSFGTSCASGWMNADLFVNVLEHFVKFMNVSKERPGLLIVDNHRSHLGLEVVNLAEEHGLNIVTFPPHCSHRLQALDVSVFGPFKTFYGRFSDAWMTSHPGQNISIYHVAEIVGLAYAKAFNPSNITSGFRSTGVFPYNPEIFTEDMFLPSSVTDIAVPENESEELPPLQVCQSSADEQILNELRPHPKTSVTSRKRKSRQQKSCILTSEAEKRKRFPELYILSSKGECSLQASGSNDDDEVLDESLSENITETPNWNLISCTLPAKSFAVVKVSNAANCKNFVAQVLSGPDKDNDYEVKFLKRSTKVKNAFIFPDVEDLASISQADVVAVLTDPNPVAHTARLSNILRFSENLAALDV